MSDQDPAIADLEAALRVAYQAEERADYEKAIQALTRAIELAGRMAPPDKIQDLRSRIAWYAAQAGRFDDAVRMYRDVLSLRERILGAAHPDVTRTLLSLASAEANRWSLTAAEMLYLSVASRLEPADADGRLELASGLAALYLRQGRPAHALKEWQEALPLVEGSGHVEAVADLEASRAMALSELGQSAEALAILEGRIRHSSPGSNPLKYVRSMVTYANVLADGEQLAKAQEVIEQAVDTTKQTLVSIIPKPPMHCSALASSTPDRANTTRRRSCFVQRSASGAPRTRSGAFWLLKACTHWRFFAVTGVTSERRGSC